MPGEVMGPHKIMVVDYSVVEARSGKMVEHRTADRPHADQRHRRDRVDTGNPAVEFGAPGIVANDRLDLRVERHDFLEKILRYAECP